MCGKKIYDSKKTAQSMINFIKKKKTRKRLPKRSYFCDDCKGWHITSEITNKLWKRKSK